MRVLFRRIPPPTPRSSSFMSSLGGIFSYPLRSSIPAIRLCGAVASGLLCIHSLSYLFSPGHSLFRILHNIADLVLFLLVGVFGVVAEVFPRGSLMHKALKSNFPFFNSLIGRGFFYVIFGFIVMGNFNSSAVTITDTFFRNMYKKISGDDDPDEPHNFYEYFTVISGIYVTAMGIVLVYNSMKQRRNMGVNEVMMTEPMVSSSPSRFVPSLIVERIPQEEAVEQQRTANNVAFPTPV